MLYAARLLALALTAITSTAPNRTTGPTAPAVAVLDRSVAFQVNAFHDGNAPASPLVPPLELQWNYNFAGAVSYPLVVDSMIYICVASNVSYGTTVYAFDATNERIVWSQPIPGTYFWSAAAYDDGKVFVLNYDGQLRAFDALSGTQLWQMNVPSNNEFTSAPTAVDGVIYVGGAGSGGAVHAIDELTQAVLWNQNVESGAFSSPVVTDRSIFVGYSCPQAYSLDRATGAVKWHYDDGCYGGGGKTAVYHRGRLYIRADPIDPHDGHIIDTSNGALLGVFDSAPPPAFDAERGYFVVAGRLVCRSVLTGDTLWQFSAGTNLVTTPIIANGYVYVGSSIGSLFALDDTTGALMWSANQGIPFNVNDEGSASVATGLGVGSGCLVVPAGHSLFVYTNPRQPSRH
jgi:outer membrane protein assembly factor BamB